MNALPTFHTPAMRRLLNALYGLPNAAPRDDEMPWNTRRVLFVDDDDDGRPIAYWEAGDR